MWRKNATSRSNELPGDPRRSRASRFRGIKENGRWQRGVQQVDNVISKFSLPAPVSRGREAGGRATCWRPPAGTQYLRYFLKIHILLRSSLDAPWTHFEFIPRPTWCIWTSNKKKCGTFAQTSGFKTPEGKLTELSANQLAPNPVSPPYPDQALERQEFCPRVAAQEAILTQRSRFTLSSRTTWRYFSPNESRRTE